MQIKKLVINRFRGIKTLEWDVTQPLSALIGPGDSTKTTILDAIEFALSPTRFLSFNESDFFNCDLNNPIVIQATVGNLSEQFFNNQKFKFHFGGWHPEKGLIDEPHEGSDPVITVQLIVDSNFEPTWSAIREHSEPLPISEKDRKLFGVIRLGSDINKHLSWGKGSILTQLHGGQEETSKSFLSATNHLRQDLLKTSFEDLKPVAKQAQEEAQKLGLQPLHGNYQAKIDSLAALAQVGAISLHDENIPLRLAGLGSKRLLALALELSLVEQGSILLIDEIESALEPYRIKHLLGHLKRTLENTNTTGQIFLTTHSPVVIEEFLADDLCVVRSISAQTNIKRLNSELQSTLRSNPSAFLAKKVIVCEGLTEIGLCRALENYWTKQCNRQSFALKGIALANGSGSEASNRALHFSQTGYNVSLLIDSDDPLNQELQLNLLNQGVKVIRWDGGCSIEERISSDLPFEGLRKMLHSAISSKLEKYSEKTQEEKEAVYTSIRQAINSKLGLGNNQPKQISKLEDWLDFTTEEKLRKAIGLAAKKNGWFKRIDFGEQLGEIVVLFLPEIPGTDLFEKIEELGKWIYDSKTGNETT